MSSTGTAPGVNLGFCNPYGAESGGPRRVLGGLYGPGSAATPGIPGLPQNVAQGEWACAQRAQVRCRATCACGHAGQPMELCSWHDVDTWKTEMVAGAFRRIRSTARAHGHYEEIQRRQCGSCPRCLYPRHGGTDYAQLAREWQEWGNTLALLNAAGQWKSRRADQVRSYIENIGGEMDLARQLGIIHNCPLTLRPVA